MSTVVSERTDASTTWLTVVAGLVVLVSLFFEGPAELERGLDGAAVRRYYESNAGAIEWLVLAETVALLGLVLLVVGLRSMARAAGVSDVLVTLIGVAGTLTCAWMWLQASVDMIPLVMADDAGKFSEYGDQTLLAIDLMGRLGETWGDVATVPRGLFVAGVSLGALQTRFLPRWLGYAGLVVAAASLLGITGIALFFVPGIVAWFAGMLGFVLWTAAVSVTLGVRAVRAR